MCSVIGGELHDRAADGSAPADHEDALAGHQPARRR